MLYVVIKIIVKTLNIAMFELPQGLKCVEKMVVVTDTDEKLLQGIVEIIWLYSFMSSSVSSVVCKRWFFDKIFFFYMAKDKSYLQSINLKRT